MESDGKFLKPLRRPPRTLFDGEDESLDAPARGALFPRPVLWTLLGIFFVASFLTVEWFLLLLLNSGGVVGQMGTLNVLRVFGVLMAGIAAPSVLLMFHYRRVYSYTSGENVFFATTFSLSFMMGLPCVLVGFLA